MFNFIRVVLMGIFLMAGTTVFAQDIYYCPMHPHYTSDKPGNCPICGMSLVKKDAQDKGAESSKSVHAIILNKNQMQLIGIRTQPVIKKVLIKTVRAAGYISTSNELFQLQDEYIKAYTDYVTAYRDIKRFTHTIRNLEPHRELQIKLHDTEDRLLRIGLGLHQIAKLQKTSWQTPWYQPELMFFKEKFQYWVVAQVFESDLGFVEVGQEADVEIPAYMEHAKGIIRSVGGIVDPQTRTTNILIELQDYKGELKGNMFVNVSIPADLNDGLVVPYAAVMDTGLKKIVYIKKSEGVFEPREIQVSAPGDEGWLLKSGLKEGQEIVVDGNFLLDSESHLQDAIGGESHDK